MKKEVERYEEVADAEFNFGKSKDLWLGAWRGSVPLPGLFHWSDRSICILRVCFGSSFQQERNWLEVQAKVVVQVGTWLQRQLSLKGRTEVCAVYIFLLILYHLSILPLPRGHQMMLKQSLSKLLWKGQSLMAHRHVCYQRP